MSNVPVQDKKPNAKKTVKSDISNSGSIRELLGHDKKLSVRFVVRSGDGDKSINNIDIIQPWDFSI